MRSRKTQIIGAVAVMFVSSIVGASALRTSDGQALDALGETTLLLEEVKDAVPGPDPIEVAQPVLDGGVGESVVLVVAAQVPSSDVAAWLSELNEPFSELQGFSFDASENYELTGLYVQDGPDAIEVACSDEIDCPDGTTTVRELQPVSLRYIPLPADVPVPADALRLVPGQSLIVSGFRTKRGAEEFLDLARALGVNDLITIQARKLGGGDIGLGQEPHPDGSGPLLGPLGDQEAFQR